MKTNINMFLFDIEHFLSDIRGPRYLHLKKVYFFVGHPVVWVTMSNNGENLVLEPQGGLNFWWPIKIL